jgi:hypothetical protein
MKECWILQFENIARRLRRCFTTQILKGFYFDLKMKNAYCISLIFISLACKNKPEKTFVLPSDDEINSIVEAVIYQDSLPVLKEQKFDTRSQYYRSPIATDLTNLDILVVDSLVENTSLNDLLKIEKINGRLFFDKSDSLYLVFQKKYLNSFSINKQLSSKLLTTTSLEESERKKDIKFSTYYDLTIPILSTDKKKAYVELTFHCTGLCGNGSAFYLEKVNNKWQIIGRVFLWIS